MSSPPQIETTTRSVSAGADDVAAPLRRYLGDIAKPATLTREEEVALAARYRAHEEAWQRALLAIPFAARAAIARWRLIRDEERVTATLSAAHRDGSGIDPGPRLDLALARVEKALARRDRDASGATPAELAALDATLVEALVDANLAPRVLEEIFEELRATASALVRTAPGSKARRALARQIGLAPRVLATRLAAIEADRAESLGAKHRFVRHNLKLVVTVTKSFRGMGVAFLDLIQEGNLGLIRAVEKFDPAHGCKFSTYAVWWIRQACIRAIQTHSRTVRLPSHVYEGLLHHRRASQALAGRTNAPDDAEIAAAMGIGAAELDQLMVASATALPIDAPMHPDGSRRLQDLLSDPDAVDVPEALDRSLLATRLESLLARLDGRERSILLERFGLAGREERTLREVGENFGLSRERVRQIEAQALARLRRAATSLGLHTLLDRSTPARREPVAS